MMRRWIGFAVLAAMLFTMGHVSPAKAIGGFVQWQSTNDMNSGFGLGLKKKFQIIPIIAIEGRASWMNIDADSPRPSLNAFPLEIVGRAKLGLIYGGGGLGYYLFSGDDPRPKSSGGGFVMGGAEFTLLGLGAFAEIRYLFLEPDLKDLRGSRDLGGFGANVGVVLPFF